MSGVELKPCSLSAGNNILVPLGSMTVGRGPFLGIADKRVSRNHAVLQIEDGIFKVKPIHVNPTYFAKRGGKLRPLKKDEWKVLENGDQISLTPNEHIFDVVIDDRPVQSVTQSQRPSMDTSSPIKSPFKKLESPSRVVTEEIEDKAPSPACRKLDFVGENNESTAEETNGGHDEEKEKRTQNVQEEEQVGSEELDEPDSKEYAQPVDRKRELPAWMTYTTAEPTYEAPPAKKPKATKASSRAKKRIPDEQDNDDGEVKPTPSKRGAPRKQTVRTYKDDDDDEPFSRVDISDDNYEVKPTPTKLETPLKQNTASYKEEDEEASSRRKKRVYDEMSDDDEVEPPRKRGAQQKRAAASHIEDDDYEPPHPELKKRTSSRGRQTRRVSYVDDPDGENVGDDDYVIGRDDEDESDWEEQTIGRKKGKAKSRSPRAAKGRKRKGKRSYYESSDEDVYIPKLTKRTAKILSSSQTSSDSSSRRQQNEGEDKIRCPHGLKCYRKNPEHFKEFSHSNDEEIESESEMADLNEDEKPECPYGADCYRKNLEHRKQFKHPATQDKPQTERGVEENGSDADGPNTYDYDDSFLDDADNTPKETLDETPESLDDPGIQDSSEDLSQLTKEAKDYMKNEKLKQPV